MGMAWLIGYRWGHESPYFLGRDFFLDGFAWLTAEFALIRPPISRASGH
jgi:hypothetical protein